MNPAIAEHWPAVVSALHILVAFAVTVDAVLRKRHVSAVIGWIGVAWLAPLVGSVLYVLFGINRIHRTAAVLALQGDRRNAGAPAADLSGGRDADARMPPPFAALSRVGEAITGRPLTTGNQVEPLENGDVAFPEMLAAIDGAARTVGLLTYIFDSDRAGQAFLQALVRAQDRGGFVGGMNIRESHWFTLQPARPTQCLHFKVQGPIVVDMQRVFVADWAFTTGERLDEQAWFPSLEAVGMVLARGLPDGPDADLDNIPHVLHAALAVATARL